MSECPYCTNSFEMNDTCHDEFRMWQGLVGPYYTPSVDNQGNLSWTNTGGLPNPSTVNIKGADGTSFEIAGIVETVGDLPESASGVWLVGTEAPYEGYSYIDGAWASLGQFAIGPRGEQGEQGEPGATGASAGFGTPTATVDSSTGTPSITITASGPDTAKVFSFSFHNLKGEKGDQGDAGSVTSVNNINPDGNGNVALSASNIPTLDNVNVQGHITAIETDVDDLKTSVTKLPESRLVGKQVAIYADSWGADYHGSFGADYISSYTGVPVHIAADPGGTLSRIYTNAWDSFNADVYVISGGLNDVGADTTVSSFVTAIDTWCTAIRNVNANAEIYFVTPPMMRTAAVHTNLYPLELYRIVIWRMAAIKGYNVINSLKWVDITLESDKTHPIVADAPKIGKHVVAAISNYGDEETHIQDYCNINGLLVSGGNNQLEYWCDAGSLFLRLQYFDQPYTSGSQVTVSFPSGYGMGTDIKSFAYTVMAGDVSPVFVTHSKDSNDVILYRKAATGVTTIYVHGATIPVHVSPLFFSS